MRQEIKENLLCLISVRETLKCLPHHSAKEIRITCSAVNHMIVQNKKRKFSKVGERICPAVTKADTNHSLNLSTVFRYILLVNHMFSSTKSRAACAMNWFRWRWSSCGRGRSLTAESSCRTLCHSASAGILSVWQ